MEESEANLFCSLEEIRFLKRSKHYLEGRFNVRILMPEVQHNSTTCPNDIIAVTVNGNVGIVRNHLQKQLEAHARKQKRRSVLKNSIPTITLSDSDSEEEDSSPAEESPAKDGKRTLSDSVVDLTENIKSENDPDLKKLRPAERTALPEFIPLCNNAKKGSSSKQNDSVVFLETVIAEENVINVTDEIDEGNVINVTDEIDERNVINVTDEIDEGNDSVVCLEPTPTTSVLRHGTVSRRPLSGHSSTGVQSNAPTAASTVKDPKKLRPIIIDGSNVARNHGQPSNTYSCEGIKICVDYFVSRGHTQVTAFVPQYRRSPHPNRKFPNTGTEILEELATKQQVVFTPSRRVQGKSIASYDDRFIVELATRTGGVILSNDNYRDLLDESPEFKQTIEERLLMFCFVGNNFMIPNDPMGRDGPKLEEFLSFPSTENNGTGQKELVTI